MAAITNIAGATYLNGLAATTAYSELHNWLTWVEDYVKVIRSPAQSDGYNRIYWTGETDGLLHVMGTFGSRTVNYPTPDKIPTITGTELYSSSGVTASWAATGCATQTLTLNSITATSGGFQAQFTFKSQTDTVSGSGAPAPTITVNIPGIGPLTAPNGLQYDLTTTDNDGNVIIYASPEFTLITPPGGTFTATVSGGNTTVVWDTMTYTVAWNMHYNFSDELCYYLMTYVDDIGVEGPPSVVSDEFHRTPTLKVVLSGIPVSTDSTITKKRIYRSAASSTSGDFYFLAEIDNATTSFIDMITDSGLAEQFIERYNPPTGLQGLTLLPNGIACAFKDRDIWFSDQFIPTSWNPANVITSGYPIVVLAASGNDCVVMTKGRPSLITGDAPNNMTQTELMVDQSCVSAQGVASVGNAVLYPSPDGLVSVTGGQAALITKQYFKRDDWQAIDPATMNAASHDNRYHGFTDNTGLILDLQAPEGGLLITTNDQTGVESVYSDEIADTLYFASVDVLTPDWLWNNGQTGNFYGLAYGNGVFVLTVADSTNIWWSADGKTWTLVSFAINFNPGVANLFFDGTQFVIASSTYRAVSLDGKAWTNYGNAGFPINPPAIYVVSTGKYYATGRNYNLGASAGALYIKTIMNADGWSYVAEPWTNSNSHIVYGNSIFVVGTGVPELYTSINASSWTSRTAPWSGTNFNLFFVGSKFIAFDSTNTFSSSDGITWVAGNTIFSLVHAAVTYGDGLYVIIGDNGTATSADGVTWTVQSAIDLGIVYAATFNNHEFVTAGIGGSYYTGGTQLSIKSWNTSTTPKILTWKSKEFQFERMVNPQNARIIAPSYNSMYLYIYANGVLKYTMPVYNDQSFRIPMLRQERIWSFAVSSKSYIDEINISTSMGDLAK